MRGYWKIEKEWMHGWGLTASEAVVLADYLAWNSNQRGHAAMCCITDRQLRNLLQSIEEKISALDRKKFPQIEEIISAFRGKNFRKKEEKISAPPTPPYIKEYKKKKNIRLDKSNLPNAVASAVKKEPRKKADKTPSIQHRCRLHFEAAYEAKKGDKYYYAAKDAAALKGVLKKIQFLMPEADKENEAALENNFKIFVDAIFNSRTLGTWINDNLSLPIINGKFNEIYAQLKDNGSNHNRINKHVSISADLLAEFTGANTGSFHNGR